MFYRLLSGILFVALIFSCSKTPTADLVLHNAQVITLDERTPAASAIAVSGDSILAVGRDDEVLALAGDETKIINLDSATVVPGLIDAHIHIMTLGEFLINLDLTGAQTWEEVVDMVEEAASKAEPGSWILGRGWHQEKWQEVPSPQVQGYPVHRSLSSVSAENPVILDHASGHAVFANALALREAGIDRNTPNPDGGIIVRDARGNATGVLLENAEKSIKEAYKAYLQTLTKQQRLERRQKMLDAAIKHLQENGITGIHNAGSSTEDVDLFKTRADAGALKMRLYVMLSADDSLDQDLLQHYRMIGYGDNMLTVRAIKEYADGALGARGAWMIQPYDDMPSTSGLPVTAMDTIRAHAEMARVAGYQLCTHAIGDRANREVLKIYSDVLGEDVVKDHRWRIEHAQHIDPVDQPRFVQNGIIASVQAIHCISDGPWVPKRIGEERADEGAYPWQSLLSSGARLANGTDAPVEPIDPMANYHASVTRMMKNGETFYPEEAMSREQALRSMTIYNAYAAFEEELKGTLAPGKLADITVLSQNISEVPAEQIRDTEILYTIIGGEVVYKQP